jgi:alkylation response protein AidB-like acyl-CoA dehydrogenase
MSQFDLNDEQRQIQEMARTFTADAITPHATEWEEKHVFPRGSIRATAAVAFGKRS